MKKCPKCGSDDLLIIMWDGARCGGHRTTCQHCKTVVEATEYYENTPDIYKVK
jgi:RNA polymerase subunit RPABC4/transcription elongation factor Spt4